MGRCITIIDAQRGDEVGQADRRCDLPRSHAHDPARAANVARQLVAAEFPPQKLSVEGFAEFRPKVPNDSTKNRGVNRRIEIVYQRGSIKKRMVDILRSQKTVVR